MSTAGVMILVIRWFSHPLLRVDIGIKKKGEPCSLRRDENILHCYIEQSASMMSVFSAYPYLCPTTWSASPFVWFRKHPLLKDILLACFMVRSSYDLGFILLIWLSYCVCLSISSCVSEGQQTPLKFFPIGSVFAFYRWLRGTSKKHIVYVLLCFYTEVRRFATLYASNI